MATKIIRIPANVPTATIKEAVQKYLKEASEHHAEDERDEKGRVKRDTISYEEDITKKGELKRIIAKLSGSSSSAFRVAIDKLKRMEELEKELEVVTEELKQEGIREKIHSLFGPAYEFNTRVVALANTYEIVMSKQPAVAETTKWADVYADLYKILTPELQAKGEEIVKQYRTIQAPKPPSIKFNVTEGVLSDAWTKIKAVFSKFYSSVKSWGSSFDKKLEDINARAKAL